MNICQVLISDGWGGAEAWVHELARCLRDKGENVSLILNREIVKYYTNLENITLFDIGRLYPPQSIIPHIPSEGIKNYLLRRTLGLLYLYLDEPLRYWRFKRVRKKVSQFLSLNQVQIIHSHMSVSTILVSNLGELKIPTIASDHGDHHLRGALPVHPLARPLRNWCARKFRKALGKADKTQLISTFMLNALEDWGIPLAGKSVVIPNGINVSDIQKAGSVPTLKLKGEFNLLFPGGPKWTKGGDLLLAALAEVRDQIPDIHLYIALDVPLGHSLRRMVSELRLEQNVTFTGFLSISEYRSLLSSVELFVMPSRLEAFGLAGLEAMALGKPIVAANTGGFTEYIENGRNGILVGLEPVQIAQAILYLYNNEPLRMQMSQNNLKDIARFDSSFIVDQYTRFYRDTLNASKFGSQ